MLSFRPVNVDAIDDFAWLAKWDNDPEIQHLILPRQDNSPFPLVTAEELRLRANESAVGEWAHSVSDLVLCDGQVIGHCSIIMNPPHKVTLGKGVAWFSLVIGRREFRGRGMGTAILAHLEAKARELGAKFAEAGVFSFNLQSQKLFLKCGYEKNDEIEDFVFWDGKFWSDLRFGKILN